MAISNEIIFIIFAAGTILFIVILFLLRSSNAIISSRLRELIHRSKHLGKIAKNHSGSLVEHENKLRQIIEQNKTLTAKIEALEKKFEKKELIESTQEMITKAINQNKQR